MSENTRLGAIVTVFVLLGMGIWMLFSDSDEATPPPLSITQSQVTPTAEESSEAVVETLADLPEVSEDEPEDLHKPLKLRPAKKQLPSPWQNPRHYAFLMLLP